MHLRWPRTPRKWARATVSVIATVLGGWIILTILRLNVETWAESNGLHRLWDFRVLDPAFHWLVFAFALALGGALALWIDWWLRRMEGEPSRLDHVAVADEADGLADELSGLVWEYKGRQSVAWDADTRGHVASGKAGIPRRERGAEADAWLLARYGERYGARVLDVYLKAQKCVSLDVADALLVRRMGTAHDISELPRYLKKLALELRYPDQPDLTPHNRLDGGSPASFGSL